MNEIFLKIIIGTQAAFPFMVRLLQKQHYIGIGFCCCSRGSLVINIFPNLLLMLKPQNSGAVRLFLSLSLSPFHVLFGSHL